MTDNEANAAAIAILAALGVIAVICMGIGLFLGFMLWGL